MHQSRVISYFRIFFLAWGLRACTYFRFYSCTMLNYRRISPSQSPCKLCKLYIWTTVSVFKQIVLSDQIWLHMAILVHYSGSQAKKKCFSVVEEQDYKNVSSFEQFWRLSFQLYFRIACQITQRVNNGTICSEMIPSGATTTNTT